MNRFKPSRIVSATAVGCLLLASSHLLKAASGNDSQKPETPPALSALTSAQKQAVPSGSLSMVIRGMPTEQALEQVAANFGLQLQPQVELPGAVNLEFDGAGLDQAMSEIVGPLNLDWMVENGRLHVFQPRQPWTHVSDAANGAPSMAAIPLVKPEEPVSSRIVVLKKRKAEDIQKLIKDLSTGMNIVTDAPTNSLICLGTEKQLAEAEQLAKSLDELPPSAQGVASSPLVAKVEFITEIFKLDHVDFDSLEKELTSVIARETSGTGSSNQQAALTKDGKPIEKEYFLLDRERRIVLIHSTLEKIASLKTYFTTINQPLAQVMIEAQIVAVDTDFEKNMGIKWNTSVGYTGPANAWSTGKFDPVQLPPANSVQSPNADTYQSFQFGKWSLNNLQALLDTAQSQNKAQVLSRPKIMSVTGKKAKIQIGTKIPYTTSTTLTDGGNTTENVNFVDVGIILDVTPMIHTDNHTVRMTVKPEVSDAIAYAKNGAPIIATRQTEATVEVRNGETMVIGGLLTSENGKSTTGVPLLRDVPVLGEFFKFSKRTNKKTNLMILITTRIVDTEFEGTLSPRLATSISMMHGNPAVIASSPIASLTLPLSLKSEGSSKQAPSEKKAPIVKDHRLSNVAKESTAPAGNEKKPQR
ncbi:MAG TPA: secretin N-terminal domain-containing protein [Candidatus Ozemobacteraceae bacterium]|nr:secretin N-terminal domain-containing protein [Candidatus Ozemobacteraceae bacterium]